jgi:hypothetical protein
MNYRLRDVAYLVVAAALGIGVYFMFRAMYFVEEPLPFAQEMTLVFLGAVVTIALTAALLNRQTELELQKEGRVIILQQQFGVYMSCIEKVAEIVENVGHDAALIDDLKILNHKLAIVASKEVVTGFEVVLEALLSGFADGALSESDGKKVMQSVADLTMAMRSDVLHNMPPTSMDTACAIRRNSSRMEQLDDLNFEAEVATIKKEEDHDARP